MTTEPAARPVSYPDATVAARASEPGGGTTDGPRTETAGQRQRLAERVLRVPPSGIRKFFDVIATMPDVISLGVGEPDFTTPPQIVEEGVRSLRSGRTHYTSNYGTIELRRALSKHIDAHVRRRLRPGHRDPGHGRRVGGARGRVRGHDRPGRRGHPPRAVVRGVRAGHRLQRRRAGPGVDVSRRRLAIGCRARRGGRSRRARRRSSSATRATQRAPCCRPETLRGLADIAKRHDLLVISDEIYDRLVYGGHRHEPIVVARRACATGPSCWAASPRRTP